MAIAQNDALRLGTHCPQPGHPLPKVCSHVAQGLFTRCPRLVHSLPKACSQTDRMPYLQQAQQPDMPKECGMEDWTLYVREDNSLGKMLVVDMCIAKAKGYLRVCLTCSCCLGCVIVKKIAVSCMFVCIVR